MSRRDLGSEGRARKPSIISIGELLWDIFPGAAHLGGSAANVAFHAAACGAKSALFSRVGRDTYGQRALAQLAKGGVSVERVGIDRTAPTGLVHVDFEDGEPRFRISSHAAWDHIELPPLEEFAQANVICMSTLAQRTQLLRGQLQEKLRTLRNLGSGHFLGGAPPRRPLIFVDLNLRPPFVERATIFGAAQVADVIKLNEQELSWVREQTQARDPAAWLLNNFDLSLVVITRGAQGAELRGRNVHVNEAGIPVSGGDTVGAGDSFVARLAVAFCEGLSLTSALSAANRYAAWVASQHGAMPVRARQNSPIR